MIIRSVKLRAATETGDFGFKFRFGRNLTIVKAKNSSGKSTLFNSILYGLGMEELIGGLNEKTLQSAVKEHFEFEDKRVAVNASEVLIELENRQGKVITLRRSIRDTSRSQKLIEIFEVAHLTEGQSLGGAKPTYLHDGGGAQLNEGFHKYLERFLGLSLPRVPTTKGGETKLYLQTIFAALAVEQKRGWTDYIATIPFYGIRDVRTRVVEFLLGLSVCESNNLQNRLNAESVAIDTEWRQVVGELHREASPLGVVLDGIPASPAGLYKEEAAGLTKLSGTSSVSLSEHIGQLRSEYQALNQQAERFSRVSGAEALLEIAKETEHLQHLTFLHERALASLGEQRLSLKEYQELLAEANEDLERNKTTKKLRDLGAKHELLTGSGRCPTCNQSVEDTLLADAVSGPQMDLDTNIAYLSSQRRMLLRQIAGLQEGIQDTDIRLTELAARVAAKHDILTAMRGDISVGATESKAIVRRQVQIEVEVEAIEKLQLKATELLRRLAGIARRMRENQLARKELPKDVYTETDLAQISIFQKQFRANASSFGYGSANISEIEISKDNLLPCLAHLELREILRTESEKREIQKTDIKADSSASDFVRLIWSYLLALHQTSAMPSNPGNHPGILMLDEPGQHSMADDSQHALLKQLAAERQLQSIVAASFDENEDVFIQATSGIDYALIEWEGKLLKPL